MTKDEKYALVIVIGAFIIFLIIYAITVGNVNLFNKAEVSEDEKRNIAKKQHEAYLQNLNDDLEAKNLIRKKRKIIFFVVRLVMVGTWFTVNITLLLTKVVPDLSTLVLYNEVGILVLLSLLFLFAGSLTSVREMLEYLKDSVENKLYENREKELALSIDKNKKGIKLIEEKYPECVHQK